MGHRPRPGLNTLWQNNLCSLEDLAVLAGSHHPVQHQCLTVKLNYPQRRPSAGQGGDRDWSTTPELAEPSTLSLPAPTPQPGPAHFALPQPHTLRMILRP